MESNRRLHIRPVINIASNNMIKSIKCDHPSSEGYNVSNLVSTDDMKKNKGFLVETFIKPPVTIIVEFLQKIDLKYVLLQCNVGAQKSSGIEISIKPDSEKIPFEYVSSGVLTDSEKGFIFHRYSENVRNKFGEGFRLCPFKSSRFISQVLWIKIKIFRTQGASVPALGRVEVWGVPHKYVHNIRELSGCDKTQHSEKSCEPSIVVGPSFHKGCNVSNDSSSFPNQVDAWPVSLKIPSDFIDPITCNLMCQPVILPSGNIVDVLTLESFEKAESQWGRVPSDPFTGIPFTSTSKPIAASDLKARIDKFLCENSDHPDLKTIPRTVGKSFALSQKLSLKPGVSRLTVDKNTNCSSIQTNNRTYAGESCEIPEKRRKVEGNVKNSTSSNREISPHSSYKTQPHSKKIELGTTSFQETSLESALRSTLARLPSFTKSKKSDSKITVECYICKLGDNLFSIPCRHYICRNCLVSLKTKEVLSCSFCKSSFKYHDVQKVHVSK